MSCCSLNIFKIRTSLMKNIRLVHPIFLVFVILVTLLCDFLSGFFRLAHLVLQNVNKDYVIFSYFHNFIAKSDQEPKTKNGMNETNIVKIEEYFNSVDLNVMFHFNPDSNTFEINTVITTDFLEITENVMYGIRNCWKVCKVQIFWKYHNN